MFAFLRGGGGFCPVGATAGGLFGLLFRPRIGGGSWYCFSLLDDTNYEFAGRPKEKLPFIPSASSAKRNVRLKMGQEKDALYFPGYWTIIR